MSKSKKLNSIEQSIIDNLNNVTSRHGHWKLSSSRTVDSEMSLSEREEKIFNSLYENLIANKTLFTNMTTKKLRTLLVQWDNGKVIESVTTLVSDKEIDRVLKYIFTNYHDELSRYYCLACNDDENDNNIYIVSVCRESGIYKFKNKTEKKDSENENENASDKDIMDKISILLNSVKSLANDLNSTDKENVAKELKALAKDLQSSGRVENENAENVA